MVGAGSIGSTVGRLGVRMGLRVVRHRRGDEVSRAWIGGTGIRLVDLDAVVAAAVILTIHVPLLATIAPPRGSRASSTGCGPGRSS